jgi:N-glycosylase/DNA lyase
MEELKNFLKFYDENKVRIKSFLDEFEKKPEDKQMLGELVFCICTPQSKAKYCRAFVESIKSDNTIFSLNLEEFRRRMDGIRFSDRKAEFIIEARNKFPKIKEKINSNDSDLREWLIKNVKGLGMKESAHVLRNLGYKGLVMIDVHVQRFLRKMGLYDSEKKSLTKKQYEELEQKFLELSDKLKIPSEELDIAIWLYESGEKEFYG